MFEGPSSELFRGIVVTSDKTTGQVVVNVPSVLGEHGSVPVDIINKQRYDGLYEVPDPGTQVIIGTEDRDFGHAFLVNVDPGSVRKSPTWDGVLTNGIITAPGTQGWVIDGAGSVEFHNGRFRGELEIGTTLGGVPVATTNDVAVPEGVVYAADLYVTNTTNISGGRIRTGILQSEGFTWDGTSTFSTAGMRINLDGGTATGLSTGGQIIARQFRTLPTGEAYFGGTLQAASGVFTGALEGGTIDIGGADATSFHVDSAGRMWLGGATWDTGTFRIDASGNTTIGGTVGQQLILTTTNGLEIPVGEGAIVGTAQNIYSLNWYTLNPDSSRNPISTIGVHLNNSADGTMIIRNSGATAALDIAPGLRATIHSELRVSPRGENTVTTGFDQLKLGFWANGTTNYVGLIQPAVDGTSYLIMADSAETFISTPGTSGAVNIRSGRNSSTHQLRVTTSGLVFDSTAISFKSTCTFTGNIELGTSTLWASGTAKVGSNDVRYYSLADGNYRTYLDVIPALGHDGVCTQGWATVKQQLGNNTDNRTLLISNSFYLYNGASWWNLRGFTSSSSADLKTDIQPLPNDKLSVIRRMRPVSYKRRFEDPRPALTRALVDHRANARKVRGADEAALEALQQEEQQLVAQLEAAERNWATYMSPESQAPELGFIAEELAAVDPSVVVPPPRDGESMGVSLERMIAVLVKAVQELDAKVSAMPGGRP